MLRDSGMHATPARSLSPRTTAGHAFVGGRRRRGAHCRERVARVKRRWRNARSNRAMCEPHRTNRLRAPGRRGAIAAGQQRCPTDRRRHCGSRLQRHENTEKDRKKAEVAAARPRPSTHSTQVRLPQRKRQAPPPTACSGIARIMLLRACGAAPPRRPGAGRHHLHRRLRQRLAHTGGSNAQMNRTSPAANARGPQDMPSKNSSIAITSASSRPFAAG